jgi:hypothetical protein
MGRTAVSSSFHEVADGVGVADAALDRRYETGWRAFLTSWKLGVILAVACVAGLIFILGSHPFSSASVSERVSDTVGEPSLCTEVGAARVGDAQETIYRCTVGLHARGSTRCFAISGREIKQFSSGTRRLGC